MRDWDILTPIESMPKITRQEFAEKLDEILDDVTDNNKAYVIHDDDKKEYVLCPAKWFDFCFDDDFGCIVNSAVRYALGRYTYMPGVVMNFVRKYMRVLDSRTIHVIELLPCLQTQEFPKAKLKLFRILMSGRLLSSN